MEPQEESDVTNEAAGVAGATLVKIAVFSVNPVTKTGNWGKYKQLLTLFPRPEGVHDAHAASSISSNHGTHHSGVEGEIMNYFLPHQNSVTLHNLLFFQREVVTVGCKVMY